MTKTATTMAAALAMAGIAAALGAAEPNTLTPAEKAAGWQLLWDGKTLNGWVGEKGGCKAPPAKGWKIEDGILTVLPTSRITQSGKWEKLPKEQAALGGGGDLVTKESFKDFELVVDFRLTRAANSGIKYFYDKNKFGGTCEEYQILDPEHPDAKRGRNGNRRVAALYDMMPASADKVVRPAGEWNTAKIVSKGSHVEHWLNGVKMLEYERNNQEWNALVAYSKYKNWPDFGNRDGRILLQDHGNEVWFKNVKIKEL